MPLIEFSDRDTLFIYGHFMKKLKTLEKIKSSPDNPIHPESVDQEIELYSSVISTIEKFKPEIKLLGNLM
ncbi:hypothetical protein [Paenibacillus wynnii]|uniref:Uncharacterized protein n=1 Tax=Paenibacillus wynnii TaxID=268407 RepID=A0A098MEW5_9BACL|nr:hypothetical protein [Paenibacillus wynnii]KGE20583.1 hypothetical protein PWYN_15445 [Paenibacillus wynnii]